MRGSSFIRSGKLFFVLGGGLRRGGDVFLRVAKGLVVGAQHLQLIVAAQAVDDQLFDHVVDDGKERHTNDHAHKAPQAAEQQDGEQHPEAGQTRGVAQDLGSDDVAVQLLQDQDEEDEPEGLDGILDQDEHR